VHCEVLEVVAPSRLVYSWRGGGIDTRLSWALEPVSEGTRLALDHTGFRGLRGLFVGGLLGKGWRAKILPVSLPALLDRWPGDGPVADLSGTTCPANPPDGEGHL